MEYIIISKSRKMERITAYTLKEELDEYIPLYDRFKKYFGYMDKGFKGKKYEIYAYNGGLFAPDEILDNICIDDEILHEHTVKLSTYDFDTEVDVNILGHIFEHSLGEIENVQAQILGEKVDNQKTKRKKDGIFYTPKYITKYIVENTLGKFCEQKRKELDIIDEEYAKGRKNRKKSTIIDLNDKLNIYREWLLSLSILDPACGSGAFLNQTVEFLIEEHKKIDELRARMYEDSLVFSDITTEILEKNIYGVDLNEESVEIAKLSLWLRTAEKGRKLNSLSKNIKCGNSLIVDPKVAGEKAFIWENEFPEIFANGGFDVIIGNPPYVHLEKIKETSVALKDAKYETYHSQGDIYCVFVEKGIDILKQNGLISYIMPNKWLQAGYGRPLREYFLKYKMLELIDFGDIQIFEGATTYPCIFISQKAEPQEEISISVLKESNSIDFKFNVTETAEIFDAKTFSGDTWVITSKKEKAFLETLQKKYNKLSDFIDGQAFYGLKTGLTEAFLINEETKHNIINKDQKASERIEPFLQGRDIIRYNTVTPSSHLILFEKGFTNEHIKDSSQATSWLNSKYPSIASWLAPFEEKGKKRTDKGDYWWELRACDYYSEFAKPKIMYQKFQVKPCFIYDEQGLYCNDSMWIIPTENKALLGVLNSKMGWWLITKYCTQIQNGCQLIWKYFGQIPIPNIDSSELTELVETMLDRTSVHQARTRSFLKYLSSKFSIENFTKKLENWSELDFSNFLKELNIGIKKSGSNKLSKSDEMEWMELFETKKTEVQALKTLIVNTDNEINKLVYELYGLNEEEIKIVEGSHSS